MRVIVAFILLISFFASSAQIPEALLVGMTEEAKIIRTGVGDREKLDASERLAVLFEEAGNHPGVMTEPFDSLTTVGKVLSDDGCLRVITWNVPLEDFTHSYDAVVYYQKQGNHKDIRVERLKMSGSELRKPENKYLDADEWPGALYYQIIDPKTKKDRAYLLLGFRMNSRLTSSKVIEAIDFSGHKIRLGAPVFEKGKDKPKRICYEYNSDVQMSMRYDERDDMITFDHLSPMQPGLEGNFAYYGPDMTFDGFFREKGKWRFVENVDVRQGKDKRNRPYTDPRDKK